MNEITDERKAQRIGMICAISSMFVWGVMPIYWRALMPIDPFIIILYRIVLTAVTCGVAVLKVYGIAGIKAPLKNKKTIAMLFAAGCLIVISWSVYVAAVHAGQTIQTSIGYYMNPLAVCMLGMVFFKERLTKYKLIAIVFACMGVLVLLVHFMRLPTIALTLAIVFAIYAAIKKHLKIQAIVSLFYETAFLATITFPVIVYFEATGRGAIHAGEPHQFIMLLFSGIATATPLILFAIAANRISMVSLGMIVYISPSIKLLISIFLFREPFDFGQLVAIMIIWIGLAFFTYGEIRGTATKIES